MCVCVYGCACVCVCVCVCVSKHIYCGMLQILMNSCTFTKSRICFMHKTKLTIRQLARLCSGHQWNIPVESNFLGSFSGSISGDPG